MKVQIIGLQKGQSRNGRDFTNLLFTKEFTCLDVANVKPGDICELTYESGYQDKATLTGVVVLKENK